MGRFASHREGGPEQADAKKSAENYDVFRIGP